MLIVENWKIKHMKKKLKIRKSYYQGRTSINILVYIFVFFFSFCVCVYLRMYVCMYTCVWKYAYILFKTAFILFSRKIGIIPVYYFTTFFIHKYTPKIFLFNDDFCGQVELNLVNLLRVGKLIF